MAYKGKYRPINPDKYEGDASNIVYRSLWELKAFKWCCLNPDVVKWSSETVVVPYFYHIDEKMHRYYPDLKIQFRNGTTLLVEIKPKSQVTPPNNGAGPPKDGRKKRRYIAERITWEKNDAKWRAASEYARQRGWSFSIWSEKTLRSMGISI